MNRTLQVLECIVYPFEIVEQEPAGKELVETGHVSEQEIFVEVREALLYCFVESFCMGIHLRSAGIRVVVLEVQMAEFLGKVFLEL